jgi:hypothetical protein
MMSKPDFFGFKIVEVPWLKEGEAYLVQVPPIDLVLPPPPPLEFGVPLLERFSLDFLTRKMALEDWSRFRGTMLLDGLLDEVNIHVHLCRLKVKRGRGGRRKRARRAARGCR